MNALRAFKSAAGQNIAEIPDDPYDIEARFAKKLLAFVIGTNPAPISPINANRALIPGTTHNPERRYAMKRIGALGAAFAIVLASAAGLATAQQDGSGSGSMSGMMRGPAAGMMGGMPMGTPGHALGRERPLLSLARWPSAWAAATRCSAWCV